MAECLCGRGGFDDCLSAGAVVSLEAVSRRPQAQARILDKMNLVTRDSVPTLRQLGRIVQSHHLVQSRVFEASPFHLFASQMSWTPSDAEPALGRSVNQVRRRA